MKTPRFTDALGHGLSDKRIDILRGIGRSGSISQAARDAEVSYKAAWQAIDTLTNLAGVPLVNRAVGGAGGGGASLTPQGEQLLELARALDSAKAEVQERWRSTAGADAQAAPGSSPFALRTSMRNQLPATVLAIDSAGPLAHVALRIGTGNDDSSSSVSISGPVSISARITRESVELLGLVVDMRVIVLCKATAVRMSRIGAASAAGATPAHNHLFGKAGSVERGSQGDEVSLKLQGGGQLVGFAPAGSGIRVGQRVVAEVDESALVIALA